MKASNLTVALLLLSSAASCCAKCVTEWRATDFVGPFSYNFDTQKLDTLNCVPSNDWVKSNKNDPKIESDLYNQAKDALIEKFWPTLELATGDPDSDVYDCPDGARWYKMNDVQACQLKPGKKYEYKGNKVTATNSVSVWDVTMAVQYVCNGQARIRSVELHYVAKTKKDCRK